MIRLVVGLGWILVTSCSTPQVISFHNEKVDFAKYNNFRVVNPTSEKEGFSADARETLDQLENAIIGQMEKRGYRLNHSADILVYYRIIIDQKTDYQVDNYPYQYDYYRGTRYYNVHKSQYDEGTLSIELKDEQSRKVVWQGTLDLKVKSRSKVSKDEIVELTIAQIFAEYPFEAGNGRPLFEVEN